MQRRLFKYFSRREHAESFLDGKMFFRTLQYFVDFEDGQVRGDSNEGTHVYRPVQGLQLDMADGRTVPLPGSEFRSSVVKGHIYIFCMSTNYSEELAKDFDSFSCVEVRDKRQLLQKARAALEARGEQVFAGPVTYRSASEPPRHHWALPEVICMTKSPVFRGQSEYRIAFGQPDVFVPENVSVQIVPIGYRNGAIPTRHDSAMIEIGSIREFCIVRTV